MQIVQLPHYEECKARSRQCEEPLAKRGSRAEKLRKMRVARVELQEGELGESGRPNASCHHQSHGITSDMLMPRHNVPDTEPPMKLALPQEFVLTITEDKSTRGGVSMWMPSVKWVWMGMPCTRNFE